MTLHAPAQNRAWRTSFIGLGFALAVALGLASLASCGGGDGVVGSGGTGVNTGVAQGTVNGFGSIVVDGLRYDDRNAAVVTEVGPDQDVLSDVKLGHRVSLEYQTDGVAQRVRVEPALAGAVASVASASQFSMLGQVVHVNTSAATGPVTQFGGGYTQPGDVRAGDSIEVHGVVVAQSPGYFIQATRIDKRAALPPYLRVTGVLANLVAGAAPGFTLGALTVDARAAALRPSGAVLANGQTVTLLALPAALTHPNAGAWQLAAAQVRVASVRDRGLDDYVSGSVSQLDAQARTFTLGTLSVRYGAATLAPAGTPLANGQYVQVRGSAAADGALVASGVTIRDGRVEVEAELKGNISGYVSGSSTFSVRDVTVDASHASVSGCPAGGLVDGLFVEVEGSLSTNGVVADSVKCEAESSDATIEREGLASAVDSAARRFTLSPEDRGSISVVWTDSTYFGDVTPASLAGKKVHVEGSIVNDVLVATQVKLDD
jgi:hypothetical protein